MVDYLRQSRFVQKRRYDLAMRFSTIAAAAWIALTCCSAPLPEPPSTEPSPGTTSYPDRSLRLHEIESTDPKRITIDLDGERRRGFAVTVPSSIEYPITVPARGELWFAFNRHAPRFDIDPVTFRIRARVDGREHVLFEEVRTAHASGWSNQRLDLTAWSGRRVELVLETSAESAVESDHAFWADLHLRSGSDPHDRPNVVIVLLDTLRPDHLGCYGYDRPTSPTIDRIAEEGALFRNAFSVAPWTDPSIAALLTSHLPSDLWQPAEHAKIIRRLLPSDVETLAGVLGDAGYFTIAASDHPGINRSRFGAGFDVFAMTQAVTNDGAAWSKTPPHRLLARIEEILEERATDRGLFFYLHLIYPHIPYMSTAPYREEFGEAEYRISEDNRLGLINLYDAEIRLTDDVLSSIMRMSAALFAEETILVVLSDHGEGFWEHGLFEHGNSLYNELLRIPLILHAPGRVPPGKTIDEIVRIIDIAPTVLDLAGVESPSSWRGASVLPLIEGESATARVAYSEFPHTEEFNARALQTLERKIIRPHDPAQDPELFNLQQDPFEHSPLPFDPAAEYASTLLRWLDEIRASGEARRKRVTAESEAPSRETLERLRSLGYIR